MLGESDNLQSSATTTQFRVPASGPIKVKKRVEKQLDKSKVQDKTALMRALTPASDRNDRLSGMGVSDLNGAVKSGRFPYGANSDTLQVPDSFGTQ
jgi:hypothetical protein